MGIKSIYEIAPVLKQIAATSGTIGPAIRKQLQRWEELTQRQALTKTAAQKEAERLSKLARDLLS